jgi:hypothetical protein
MWEQMGQDLKYALRQMRRSPGFTAVALLTLALGLGATTAIFSIVNGVLLQPLRYREPGRLYMAENIPPAGAGLTRNLPVNARHFHEWRMHCRSCEDVALFQGASLTLVGAGEPVRLPALEMSYNFFRTLGVQPAIGRGFLEEEEGAGNAGEVILTDALWHSRFAGDGSIVGRRIQINGEPHLVIGIMPPDLHLPRGEEWGAFVGGASRLRLFALVLMEALVLVTAGGAAGLGLAYVGLKLFAAQAPVAIPRLDEVHMDWLVLAFAASSSAFSTILCGIVPAWRLARIEPQESLKAGSGNATRDHGGL